MFPEPTSSLIRRSELGKGKTFHGPDPAVTLTVENFRAYPTGCSEGRLLAAPTNGDCLIGTALRMVMAFGDNQIVGT